MPAPTFITKYAGPTPAVTSPQTVSVTTAVGDTLVCYGMTDDSPRVLATPTGGTGLNWVLSVSQAGTANTANAYMWTTNATTAQTFTFSLAASGGSSDSWCFDVLRFSGVGGIGAKVGTHTTGAPTLNVTTTKANSAIVVCNVDWNTVSGTSRTWRANAGALTETRYNLVSSAMTVYGGYHADAGAIGTYAVGLSAPAGQTYSILGLELQPAAVNTSAFMPFFGMGHHDDELEQRSSGLYVQRRKLAGIRPNGGKDRVLARV